MHADHITCPYTHKSQENKKTDLHSIPSQTHTHTQTDTQFTTQTHMKYEHKSRPTLDVGLAFYQQPCHVPHAQEGAGDHHEGGAERQHVGDLAEVGHSQAALDLTDHQDEEAAEKGEEEEGEAVLEVEASLQLEKKVVS